MPSGCWNREVARSRPPRDAPRHRVLVHGAAQETYVAERNPERDGSGEPVSHPLLTALFENFDDGRSRPAARRN